MSRLRHISPPRLCLAAVLAALLTGLLASPAPAQAPTTRPNIVLIMTDDQSDETLRVMRNLDFGMRRQGTTFQQAISSFPLCCPSRATYLTGQYSHNNRVFHNVGQFGGYKALDNTNTLPIWLQRAGYHTIHLGRYLNGYGTQNPDITEIPPGWSEWHSLIDPSTFDMTSWQLNENGEILNMPSPERAGEHQTDFLGRRAAELIEAAAADPQPFFMSLTFAAPHSSRPREPDDPPVLRTPYVGGRYRDAFSGATLPRPPNFNELRMGDKPQVVADRRRIEASGALSIEQNYQQELESLLYVDDAVGTLLAGLEKTGEAANTLVIYTADNGFFHGEHRVRSEKVLPYEPALRIPLVMRGPGVPVGRELSQLVANVDLAPTILDAAGAVPGRVQDGLSLLPLLSDPTRELGREIVLENGQGANRIPAYRGLRNERYTYVRHDTTGEVELYDLREDPFQLQSLDESESYDLIRRRLAQRLRTLEACAGSDCRIGQPAVKVRLRQLVPVAARNDRPKRGGRKRRPLSRATPSLRSRPLAGCLRRDLRLGLYGREAERVERVRWYIDGRVAGRDLHEPFQLDVARARLEPGAVVGIRARVMTEDGRVVTRDRLFRTCAGA